MEDLHLLLDYDEKIFIETRLHIFFIAPFLITYFLVFCVLIFLVDFNLFEAIDALGFSFKFYFSFGLFIFLCYGVLDSYMYYIHSKYLVTSKRIIITKGWIKRNINSIYIDRLESTVIRQSLLGQILNFGSIILRGVGGGVILLALVPNAYEFASNVQRAIDNIGK